MTTVENHSVYGLDFRNSIESVHVPGWVDRKLLGDSPCLPHDFQDFSHHFEIANRLDRACDFEKQIALVVTLDRQVLVLIERDKKRIDIIEITR
jgi:hypothetical protein